MKLRDRIGSERCFVQNKPIDKPAPVRIDHSAYGFGIIHLSDSRWKGFDDGHISFFEGFDPDAVKYRNFSNLIGSTVGSGTALDRMNRIKQDFLISG